MSKVHLRRVYQYISLEEAPLIGLEQRLLDGFLFHNPTAIIDTIKLESDSYYDDSSWRLAGDRPESEIEKEARLKRQAYEAEKYSKAKKKREEQELKQYERLHKKYGTPTVSNES